MPENTLNADALIVAWQNGGWTEVESILEHISPAEGIQQLNQLLGYLRFERKDLAGVVKATDLAQSLVGPSSDPDVLSAWKAICYNRAAHFWRGWGDEDVTITPDMEAEAEGYAQTNFDLAVRLNKGAIAMGRAEWLLGAFQWSNNDRPGARLRFETAAGLLESGDPREAKMVRAYAVALSGEDPEPVLRELEGMEEGKAYADQVRRAIEVLG